MTDIAAPAVHVDKWKRWDFLERCRNTVRSPAPDCGVMVNSDGVFFEELSTGKLYDLPPLSIDAQAWYNANRDDLVGGKNYIRRRQQARHQLQQQATPRTGPFNYTGWYYSWLMQYFNAQHVTYMATFFGVSQNALTNSSTIIQSIWPGLEPNNAGCVLQPIMIHLGGVDPLHTWRLWDVINIPGVGQLSNPSDVSVAPISIQPQGIWGVIRGEPAQGRYIIQSYRGNAGNKGPGFQRPLSLGLPVAFQNPFFNLTGVRLQQAYCVMELSAAGSQHPPFDCSDISIQAVFGGVTIRQGAYDFLPVNWPPGFFNGGSGGVTCAPSPSIANGINNGTTQLTVGIASS